MSKPWSIYIKPYLEHPETVVKYLSRYTYRISLERLCRLQQEKNHETGGSGVSPSLSDACPAQWFYAYSPFWFFSQLCAPGSGETFTPITEDNRQLTKDRQNDKIL